MKKVRKTTPCSQNSLDAWHVREHFSCSVHSINITEKGRDISSRHVLCIYGENHHIWNSQVPHPFLLPIFSVACPAQILQHFLNILSIVGLIMLQYLLMNTLCSGRIFLYLTIKISSWVYIYFNINPGGYISIFLLISDTRYAYYYFASVNEPFPAVVARPHILQYTN